MKKAMSLLLLVCMLMAIFSGCSSDEGAIVGKWYNEYGECLRVSSDGSWAIVDSIYKGTWSLLDDNVTYQFVSNTAGKVTTEIETDKLGKYIFFGGFGVMYKDAYPGDSQGSTAQPESESEELRNLTQIDPFDGIQYEVGGISPFCTIAINEQGCSAEAQEYVTYTLDKEIYANGDTAIITASLSDYADEDYALTAETAEFTVSGQSEYVASSDQIDMDFLTGEVKDKITALISASIGNQKLCDENVYTNVLDLSPIAGASCNDFNKGIASVTETHKNTYLSVIKAQKQDTVCESVPYNMCSFIYCFEVTGIANDIACTGKLYVNITANNVVRFSDGSISWDNGHYNLDVFTATDGLDNCVTTTIMCNSDNYNITKIA